MKELTIGSLSLSLGETGLSAWEAASLKPGDVVVTSREAGYPSLALFNGLPIAYGEVVVFGDNFGFRVVDNDFRPDFQYRLDRGPIGDILPAVVCLGTVTADLTELVGMGRGSFIYFGQSCDGPANAELLLAGLPIARGKAVVVGESMGLRVTENLHRWPAPADVRCSGNLADAAAREKAKDYDFRRPDRWSLDQIDKLRDIHRLFLRHLAGWFPERSDALDRCAVIVDQCTLGEAAAELVKLGLTMITSWEHLVGQAPAARSSQPGTARVRPGKRLYEPVDSPNPLSDKSRQALAAWSEAPGWMARNPVWFYRPAAAASVKPAGPATGIGTGVGGAEDDPSLLASLRNAWRKYLDFDIGPAQPPIAPGELHANEMVITVFVRGTAPNDADFCLVYPYLTLEPYMGVLGR